MTWKDGLKAGLKTAQDLRIVNNQGETDRDKVEKAMKKSYQLRDNRKQWKEDHGEEGVEPADI